MLKLYDELAAWWPLLSAPSDYADEATFFKSVLSSSGLPPSPSLLELGCGGGNNAWYLKSLFADVMLTDLSPAMLEVSRGLNPDCQHVAGDMRSVRLGRDFDAVFVHDAIEYMVTHDDLKQAMATAFVHCKPGGIAMFVPDHVRETFEPSTEHGGEDGPGRALRYIEWTFDPDESDTMVTVEYAYLLRDGDGPVRVEHEQHVFGLFPRADWLRLLGEVGFEVTLTSDPYDRDVFIARRPH